MSAFDIRPIGAGDVSNVRDLLQEAFEGSGEARLVDELRVDGDVVLELGSWSGERLLGVVIFSRLMVRNSAQAFPALALAPVATTADARRSGVASALISTAHRELIGRGEHLSFVLGEPDFYQRFGYKHAAAAAYSSEYQGPYLQAAIWGTVPDQGQLHYAPAFGRL